MTNNKYKIDDFWPGAPCLSSAKRRTFDHGAVVLIIHEQMVIMIAKY